ncbi:hypothetical protein WBP06_18310 (plasmid) [Novosphingobium sp. BL-8H]|uniref:hypothetical protein n=1 Tax=Novosphingobium sp. BL-8H TaxID=3127640 RepID=UPI0037581F9A
MADANIPDKIPPTEGRTLTEIDQAIAGSIYPILVAVAGAQPERTITFENLILDARQQLAGQEHPIHTQIATSMGRRLEVLRGHTQAYQYPDLSSLVVNTKGENPLPEVFVRQAHARAFDWTTVAPEFLAGLGIDLAFEAPQLRRSEDEAKIVMAAHWREHGKRYDPRMIECRKAIIEALIRGEEVVAVFAKIDSQLRGSNEPDELVAG